MPKARAAHGSELLSDGDVMMTLPHVTMLIFVQSTIAFGTRGETLVDTCAEKARSHRYRGRVARSELPDVFVVLIIAHFTIGFTRILYYNPVGAWLRPCVVE